MSEDADGRTSLEGAYTAIDANKHLAFSWCHVHERVDGAREASPTSYVSVHFDADGAGTRVRLRHDGIVQHGARQTVGGGWEASFAHLHATLTAGS